MFDPTCVGGDRKSGARRDARERAGGLLSGWAMVGGDDGAAARGREPSPRWPGCSRCSRRVQRTHVLLSRSVRDGVVGAPLCARAESEAQLGATSRARRRCQPDLARGCEQDRRRDRTAVDATVRSTRRCRRVTAVGSDARARTACCTYGALCGRRSAPCAGRSREHRVRAGSQSPKEHTSGRRLGGRSVGVGTFHVERSVRPVPHDQPVRIGLVRHDAPPGCAWSCAGGVAPRERCSIEGLAEHSSARDRLHCPGDRSRLVARCARRAGVVRARWCGPRRGA